MPGRAEALGWSPDGRTVAYAAGEVTAHVTLLDTLTGARRRLASVRAQQGGGAPAFSPVAVGPVALLGYTEVRLARPGRRLPLRQHVVHGLAWSPDGRQLALALLGEDLRPAVAVVDPFAAEPEPRILTETMSQAVEHLAWSPDGSRVAFAATWPG